jgi:hypothetical protein
MSALRKLVVGLLATAIGFGAVVTIDTLNVAGMNGSLDFQFNGGPFGSQAAFVTITNVGGNGTLAGPPITSGDSTGALPGAVTIGNGSFLNDYTHPFVFGDTLTFEYTFGGPAVTAPDPANFGSGSELTLTLLDFAGVNAFPTTDDVSGTVLTVDLNNDGTIDTHTFALTPTPEPSSIALTVLAIGSTLFRRRSR